MLESLPGGEWQFFYLYVGPVALLCFLVCSCFYNLYLHPLSRFPGPRLAAMSSLYEFWFDVIKDGQLLWEIERMHEKYGPIVRVNPRQLHIRDSEYYSAIYAGGSRRVNKDPITLRAFGARSSLVATVDHYHHRQRRGYLNQYFSKRAILDIEPIIHERIGKLCECLEASMKKDEVVPLDSAFSAMIADIIAQRFFGEHFNYLNASGYKLTVTKAFFGLSVVYHLARFIPGLVSTAKKLPVSVVRMILPPVADLMDELDKIRQKIISLDKKTKQQSKSVILSALGDPNIPLEERGIDRLLDEGMGFILGGTETTSRALSVGMFFLLNEKLHVENMRKELSGLPLKPDDCYTISELEPLPYLTGVVHESIRLSFGPISLLPRVATHESLQYRNFTIPPGTPVSQSTYFVHTDPAIFPDPFSFDPNRWTKAAQEGIALNKFLVSFTKGSRQCIGIQVAFTELYLTFARIVGTFDMDLYETSIENIKIHHVRISGYPEKAKNKDNVRGEIRVKVIGKHKVKTS